MSEDTQKIVSEETISAIVGAATHIAEDSDAMRQNLIAVAKALQPIIERAGIRFGSLEDSQLWTVGADPDKWTSRIAIGKDQDGWTLGVESTLFWPEQWDGSRWIGHPDPFCADAYANHSASLQEFSRVSRADIAKAIERLPAFIEAYAAELKRRHQKYADLRKKAEHIREVLEETA